MTRRIVVAGASRGIGAAVAAHYAGQGDAVFSLSRGRAAYGNWIACDLADPAAITAAAQRIDAPVNALIFVAGIWEETAFSPSYEFAGRPEAETTAILSVNLRAPILMSQALIPALAQGQPGRIILIGSTSGLDNIGTPEVAYNASKAGLRGAAQALSQALAGQGIGVTLINPGDVATEEVIAAKTEGTMRAGGSVAISDVIAAVDFALGLSQITTAGEINLIPIFG